MIRRVAAYLAIVGGALLVLASSIEFGLVGGLYATGLLLMAAGASNLS